MKRQRQHKDSHPHSDALRLIAEEQNDADKANLLWKCADDIDAMYGALNAMREGLKAVQEALAKAHRDP